MKISVIVPVYNVAPYLDRCVHSIMNQTHTELEILLFNDGSTDESGALCDALAAQDARIRVFHGENKGLAAVREMGVNAATSEYLCFVDSDDFVAPTYVSDLLALCQQYDCPMATCSFHIVEEADAQAQQTFDEVADVKASEVEVLDVYTYLERLYTPVESIYCSLANKLFKKELFEGIHFPEGRVNEDEATIHLLVWAAQRVAMQYKPLYFYAMRPQSIMRFDGFHPKVLDSLTAYSERMAFLEELGFTDLIYKSQKAYLVNILQYYNRIDDETEDGAFYKKHLKELYADMLWQMTNNKAASKKFVLRMWGYKFNMKAFRRTGRNALLYGEG